MAKVRKDQPLVPSVLDRLLDENPESDRDPPKSHHQILRELKQSVRRDLEHLLNTRERCTSWPEDLSELDLSLLNYGSPDFTGVNMSVAAEREKMRATVEKVIRRFEPRFKSVKVALLENVDDFDRTLRFRIDALLQLEPAPEPVVFDSRLEPSTANFKVTSHKS